MRYNFDEIIKERLENRYLWRSYLRWLLTHKDLTIYAKREFYKDKPFLSLVKTGDVADGNVTTSEIAINAQEVAFDEPLILNQLVSPDRKFTGINITIIIRTNDKYFLFH